MDIHNSMNWLHELPELRIALLTMGFFCCVSVALYFVFQIMGKGKQLIWMMFRTVVEATLTVISSFVGLLCLGVLMKDFMAHGLQGMFPTAIEAYNSYVTTPLLYSWMDPIEQLQDVVTSFNFTLNMFQ